MKVFFKKDVPTGDVRAHPYENYYDFKTKPELIPQVLEDFRPWASYPAVQLFYEKLKWLNGASSLLESNDSAFRGGENNPDGRFAKKLQCRGRLMVFYRDLYRNLSPYQINFLGEEIERHLFNIDPEFEWGCIRIEIFPSGYTELPIPEDDKFGYELGLLFWAYGDDVQEAMNNLERVLTNLFNCLQLVSEELKTARQ